MKITKIEPQKRHRDRRSVYIDGSYAVGISLETLIKLDLFEGKEVDEEELKRIVFEIENEKAKNYAKLLLSYRERSPKEIEDRLKEKGYSEEVIHRVISDLNETGLLDKKRFARMWIKDRLGFSGKGKRLITLELLKKGLKKEEIEEAFKNSDFDELEIAKKMAERYLSHLKDTDPLKGRKKLYDYLVRRGFSFEVIEKVLNEL